MASTLAGLDFRPLLDNRQPIYRTSILGTSLYRKLKEYVESLIRNQIKNGHFAEEVLTASFNLHSQVRVLECFV